MRWDALTALPSRTWANRSGSGGRTYSGVCAAGQATGTAVSAGITWPPCARQGAKTIMVFNGF
jgi:hypothetical protein